MSDEYLRWRNHVVAKPMTANPEYEDAYMFLNDVEVTTVEAMAECIFPSDASGPGAREAAVVVYIDRALAGFGSSLQNLYRRGLAELDRFTSTHRGGKAFAKLSSVEQNQVLQEVEAWGNPALTEASRIAPSLEASSAEPGSELRQAAPGDQNISVDRPLLFALFAAVREHTIEGMFCDPMYGGNRNLVGWRLVGFPGAQWGYSAEQAKAGFDATTIPIKGLADLRRERRSPSKQSQSEGGLS
jgi:gluconate 2-dehydrogenase gamma chain